MLGQEIPINVDTNTSSLTFVDLHQMFADHPYGASLGSKTRWDEYKPEGVTNEEWIDLLGVDADNLTHMHLTYGIARQFIKHSNEIEEAPEEALFDDNEQRLLLLCAIVHDWPEAITGDIMFYKKTEDDEKNELSAFERMVNEVLPPEYQSDLSPLIESVIQHILKDRTSKLGKAFNAIERIGYMRTALTAYDARSEVDEELNANFTWLTSNVLSYQIPKMLEYAVTYPAMSEYLSANRDRISRCFSEIDDSVFKNYKEEDQMGKHDLYYKAKSLWEASNFCETSQVPS